MGITFSPLQACDIECRIAVVRKTGVSLLLYKDARVDMRALDSSVGRMNWQRSHQIIDGNLYCTISIWDEEKKQWVSKQDVGVESYAEKEKGQASDSFKRAGFNWGIGRELYTAPFIWIPSSKCEISAKGDGYTCSDRFKVRSIQVEDGNITALEITNEKTGNLVFSWGKTKATPEEQTMLDAGKKKIPAAKQKALEKWIKDLNVNGQEILENFGAKTFADLTEDDHYSIMRMLAQAEEKLKKQVISAEEAGDLAKTLADANVNIPKLLERFGVESVEQLNKEQYGKILGMLAKKK